MYLYDTFQTPLTFVEFEAFFFKMHAFSTYIWFDSQEQNVCSIGVYPSFHVPSSHPCELGGDREHWLGGLAGFRNFEWNAKNPSPQSRDLLLPSEWIGWFDHVFIWDGNNNTLQLKTTSFGSPKSTDLLRDEHQAILKTYSKSIVLPKKSLLSRDALHIECNKTEYIKRVQATQEAILEGRFFEANMSQRYWFEAVKMPLSSFYPALRTHNPGNMGGGLVTPTFQVVSGSPERFVQIKNGRVRTSPIKGTIHRDLNPVIDEVLKRQLQHSIKDRAENIMIVDLMRNDLSRLCTPDSIHVEALCRVETKANLHHLVSDIVGTLEKDKTPLDVLNECFPGGSVTGAPKSEVLRFIRAHERFAREAYCGHLWYYDKKGDFDSNILIRSAYQTSGKIAFHSGGAITLHSNPEAEHDEIQLKANLLCETFTGCAL